MLITILRIYALLGLNNLNLETMKKRVLYLCALSLVASSFFTSCKKDRGPRLIVFVQEEDGTPAPNARVHAYYGDNAGQPGSVLNEQMNQISYTDATGEAMFDFKYSAVLDVDVTYYKTYPDSINPSIMITDTLSGHEVVKVEQVRQKDKTNNYYAYIDVK